MVSLLLTNTSKYNTFMKYLLTTALSIVLFVASSQESQTPPDSIPFELRKQAYIYNMAKKYNDPAVARMALYNLIATSDNSLHLMDTLALMYFNYEQYASAALITQDIQSINPDDMLATEIAAISFENLGVSSKSITYYEKLYLDSNDMGTLYKVTFLQYQSKRYEEALVNADAIIESADSEELQLVFPTKDKKNQQISMKTATIRLKGMIEEDKGNTSLAKEYYQKALEMAPDFEILKDQITNMDK